MRRVVFAMLVLVTGAAGVLTAQEGELERRELERRLRELSQELRQVERQLRQYRVTPRAFAPNVISIFNNRARLGVVVQTRTDPDVDSIGALLTAVVAEGPADEAGLKEGDIITKFDGERLVGRYPAASDYESESGIKLVDLARDLEPGDTVRLEYRRGNETGTATVVAKELGSFMSAYGFEAPDIRVQVPDVRVVIPRLAEAKDLAYALVGRFWLDMELVKLNPELGEYFGTDEGLLVVRAPRETSLGLRSGDVILSIGGRGPASPSHAFRILRSYDEGETIEMEIMRQRRRMTVTGEVPERDRGSGSGYWNRYEN